MSSETISRERDGDREKEIETENACRRLLSGNFSFTETLHNDCRHLNVFGKVYVPAKKGMQPSAGGKSEDRKYSNKKNLVVVIVLVFLN